MFGVKVIHPPVQRKKIVLTVKHGAGSRMAGGCFATLRPGFLFVDNGTIHSALYQTILNPFVFLQIFKCIQDHIT